MTNSISKIWEIPPWHHSSLKKDDDLFYFPDIYQDVAVGDILQFNDSIWFLVLKRNQDWSFGELLDSQLVLEAVSTNLKPIKDINNVQDDENFSPANRRT